MEANIELSRRVRPAGLAERVFVRLARRLQVGRLTVILPNGGEHVFVGRLPGPSADLEVKRNRLFRRMLLGGDVGFAEAFMDGDCEIPDIAALVELAAHNDAALRPFVNNWPLGRLLQRLVHLMRGNSRRGARRNIARHYDLGNGFYEAWLDPSMTYSAALFEKASEDLTAAQERKYRRVAELAGIGPEHHVLEIGCGWAGFAVWAARTIGCRVTAVTISRAQHDFAAARIAAAGLTDRVELRLQDYRDVQETYDRIVSIEMIEAVGARYWPTYFRTLYERLKPGGRAALQAITIDHALFDSYRRTGDFIQRYIFPGGMLPSPEVLRQQVADAGLAWAEAASHGLDYARTLSIWHGRFEEAWPRIRESGFDERFRRMWRYYLAYCEGGFRAGRIDLWQFALARN